VPSDHANTVEYPTPPDVSGYRCDFCLTAGPEIAFRSNPGDLMKCPTCKTESLPGGVFTAVADWRTCPASFVMRSAPNAVTG